MTPAPGIAGGAGLLLAIVAAAGALSGIIYIVYELWLYRRNVRVSQRRRNAIWRDRDLS